MNNNEFRRLKENKKMKMVMRKETMEELAGKLSAFITGNGKADAIPCILTLGAGEMAGHIVNTLVCIHKGYKFQYVFLNKEGGNAKKAMNIIVDAGKSSAVLRGICMFKEDVCMEISEEQHSLEIATNNAQQVLSALNKDIEKFSDETTPVLAYTVSGESFLNATKKSLSIENNRSIGLTFDNDGALYMFTTDNSRIAYEKIAVEANQQILVFAALQKALGEKAADIKSAFEKQDVEFFKSLGSNVTLTSGEAFQIVRLAIGGNPIMALTVRDGELLDDTRTFIAGTEDEKKQLLAVPALQVEMQNVVEEFFASFRNESYIASKDLKLVSSLFAGAEKINVTVFQKTMLLAMDGLALTIPFSSKDIPGIDSIRAVIPTDSPLVAEIDNMEFQTALSFLVETQGNKEQNLPLCIEYGKNKLKLSVYQGEGATVEVALKNEIPEEEPSFLNSRLLKQALVNTERGTIAFGKTDNRYLVSVLKDNQLDMEHVFTILGVQNPKIVQEVSENAE